MDAQNAVEATIAKPSASPKRHSSTVADTQSKTSVAKSPTLSRSSPSTSKTAQPNASASHAHDDDDGTHDGSSEAETIVLPGKDGHSPSKSRKVIKHEDKNDGVAAIANVPASRKSLTTKDGVPEKVNKVEKPDNRERGASKSTSAASGIAARDQRPASMDRDRGSALPGKKRRLHEKNRSKDGSSGLSSAPTSPPHHRRRRFSNAQSESGSDNRHRSPKLPSSITRESSLPDKDKPRSLDKQLAHKRKAPKLESDEEAESRKVRRQRTAGVGGDAAASGKENASNNSGKPGKEPTRGHSQKQQEGRPTSRTRSISPQPQPRAHRRSISTQLPPSANGMSHKKKRIPAPLQSTDYPSDDSSANGSPHIRSSKLRNLATPATADSNMSPAKHAMPHKKHLDAHGQTYLARACARGELEHARQRLGERPEDLNVADFAGNTPLQIAALNGFHEIVQLLIDAGCQLDCVNREKDTPLHDAVDNDHLEVVKILLNAGVSPREPNVHGQEPHERVDLATDNGHEIKAALLQAKKRIGDHFRASEDLQDQDEAHDSHDPDNPRRSPGTGSSSLAGTLRRSGTVRANKTSHAQLYLSLDAPNLQKAAARGQLDTVTRILEVLPADTESMVAAARGGHDMVMEMLLAIGKGDPDAAPVSSIAAEHATPMLAAIGQKNIKIIHLLLNQNNFDPTRRFKGETYYEIAKRRQGLNWKEEEQLLKDAFDAHRKSRKDGKTKSPAKRDQDRETRRAGRLEPKSESTGSHKRKASSPSHETARHRAPTSPNEKRRSNSFSQNTSDQTSPKRGPGRPKKDDRIPDITISDREGSPTPSKQNFKSRKSELDTAPASSDGETPKPRRKLVSGRDLKKEHEKQRRASMASTSTVGPTKEGSSPRDSRHEDIPEKQKSDKTLDRTKQLKRDESRESRDRASASDGTGNRHRASATPPHQGMSEKDVAEGATKKRRLDSDAKDVKERKKQKMNAPADDRPMKPGNSRDQSTSKKNHKERDDEGLKPTKPKKREPSSDRSRRESGKSATSEKSIHVRSEEPDTEMPDAVDPPKERAETEARAAKDRDEAKKKAEEAETLAAETKNKDEEAKRRDAEDKEKKHKLAEEEAKRKELDDKKAKEEQQRKQQEEAEMKRQEEVQRKRKDEEEKKRRDEEEQRRREAEEKKRRDEDVERKKREAEAEILRKEAAAEEARRKLEEEQRKEEERKERLRREEERRRAAREAERTAKEAEQRRLYEEKEQLRLAKLPYLLRWLDQCENPKTTEHAELFRAILGIRAGCLRPELEGTAERELWVLNTQVALLLGEKDLALSRFTAWERIPASRVAKKTVYRWSSGAYQMQTFKHEHLARSMGYFHERKTKEHRQAIQEHREKFLALDTFFVKLSDFMFMVPSFPHLRHIKMVVCYHELSQDEDRLDDWPQKWKNDPTPAGCEFHQIQPVQLYINGQWQGVLNPRRKAKVSVGVPFPENPGPRRGLMAVARDDPDYERLCIEQGLSHLVPGSSRPSTSSDGGHSGVTAVNINGTTGVADGLKTVTPLVNGDHGHQDAGTTAPGPKELIHEE